MCDEGTFIADLQAGTLPQVAFVKPAANEHPNSMGGLLEEDRLSAQLSTGERARKAEYLLLAAGERAGLLREALLEPREERQCFLDALAADRARDQAGADTEVLFDGEPWERRASAGHLRDAALHNVCRRHPGNKNEAPGPNSRREGQRTGDHARPADRFNIWIHIDHFVDVSSVMLLT